MGDDGRVTAPSSEVPEPPNPEAKTVVRYKVYKRRWFALLVLCLLNCSNAMVWLTFAPVADQSSQYLHVGLQEVNWLSLVFMVVSIPVSFVTTWMLDTLGLRITLILGSWLNMLGAVLRFCGTLLGRSYLFPVVMLGQTLGALAQPLIIFTPTKQVALWFPDHQRATANTIATMSNPLGILLANIISPVIVKTSQQIPTLLFVSAIPACVTCFLATVGIRSSTPPTPPSASAELSTPEPFIQGLKQLLRNKAYLVLLLCMGSVIATYTCVSTLLEQILCVQGYDDGFAGICGALFIVFGIVGAGALGLIVDKTKRFTEATKINMCLTALASIAFAVVSMLQRQKAALIALSSLFGFFGSSFYPVSMELCVECSYPVGEATSTGLIFVSGQVQSVVYVMLLQALTTRLTDAPQATCGDVVLSWRVPVLVLAGLFTLSTCVFVICFHTRYRRLEAEERAVYGQQPGGRTSTEEEEDKDK